jgi:RNA polymerase sigma-70 factor (ECF subfamily)
MKVDAQEFEDLRRYLFSIAYRLVGSASEAEDIVQDAWLRLEDTAATQIQSLKAYLSTIVTRQSLDHLRSARHQREIYVGPWLPEPVLTADLAPSPARDVEREEDVSMAFLLLLERLTPEERATYVLREAFGYPYDDIAAVLKKSTPAIRQLSVRARKHVTEGKKRYTVTKGEQRRLAAEFMQATRSGNLERLRGMLVESAVGIADGGAAVQSARRPIQGGAKVARWLAGIGSKWLSDVRMTIEDINGASAGLFWYGSELELGLVLVPEITEAGFERLHAIRNPEKLAHLQRRLDSLGHRPQPLHP